MRHLCKLGLILLPAIVLALAGCGGSSSGSGTADPFASSSNSTGNATATTPTTATTPVTAQDPEFSLSLLPDLKKIDVNNGTVLLTAELLKISGGVFIDPTTNQPVPLGAAVSNQTVSFRILAGPGAINNPTAVTDKNGVSYAIYTSGDMNYTTNVIIEATSTVDGKNYRGYASFQIVRGDGVIMFTTDAGLAPGGQSDMFDDASKTVDPSLSPAWDFMQLIPFKVTDSNGNPRVNVPVTISVYSITTLNPNDVFVDFLVAPVTESSQQTITTDSAGQGIFNGAIRVNTPVAGGSNVVNVVFKAVTNDPIPVVAYVGGSYALNSKPPTPVVPPLLVLAPTTTSFGTSTDIFFTISGGVPAYRVICNKPDLVTATLQADGVTVKAHLTDTSQWTGNVAITVTDSVSSSATSTLTR
jgi:hypothetical protein